MQDFFRFMVKTARRLGSIAYYQSTMKQVFLVFLMTVSLSRATEWENEATLLAVCDNSTMHLSVNFTNAFHGAVYQSRNYFNPKCSYMVPINMNVTEMELSMQFGSCDIKIQELENRTIASTEIIIQMYNLLDSIYDKALKVSCEIDHFHNETESEEPNVTSSEVANGLVVRNADFTTFMLVSANESINATPTTIDSNLVRNEFFVDWQTFCFIALVTFCLFITIVACYCVDERK